METEEYLAQEEEGQTVERDGEYGHTGSKVEGSEGEKGWLNDQCDGSEHGYTEGGGLCMLEEVQEGVEKYVDLDLDTLTYRLEEQHQGMKKALVAFFVEMRGKLKDRGAQDLAVSRAKYDRALKAKQEEVWILEKELGLAKKNVKSLYSTLSLFADVRCS